MQSEHAQIRIISSTPLSENWGKLTKYTFDFRRRDGEWQRQSREVYDRGNGAVILLYNRAKRSVVLTRQFRLPLFVSQHHGFCWKRPPDCWMHSILKSVLSTRLKRKPATALTRCKKCLKLDEPGLGNGETAFLHRRV